MWTRKLLKTNAKHVLSRSYWQVFLACLITSLLCGTIELRYNVGSNSASSLPQEAAQLASNQGFPYSLLLPYLFTLGTLAILLFLLCGAVLDHPGQPGHPGGTKPLPCCSTAPLPPGWVCCFPALPMAIGTRCGSCSCST